MRVVVTDLTEGEVIYEGTDINKARAIRSAMWAFSHICKIEVFE